MLVTLALAFGPLAFQAPASPAAGARTHDLSCKLRVAEPVFVSTRATTKGVLYRTRGAITTDLVFDRSVAIDHLDEFTSFDKPQQGDFMAARRYIKWHVDERKAVRDPEWNGAWLRLGVVDGSDSLELQERGVRRTVLDVEAQRIDSVGAWLPLPERIAVGERVELDPLAVGHLLHFIEAPVTGKAEFVLASVSPELVATISGPLEFSRRLEEDGIDEIHRGKCALEVDLVEHKLARVEWKGDYLLADPTDPRRYSGKVQFKYELSTQRGAAAKQAGNAKSVQRDRDWHFETAKLDFELPSHWFDLQSTDPTYMLLESALFGIDTAVQLELKLVDVGLGGADMTMDAALKLLRDDKTLDIREEKSTTCALGRGKVLRVVSAEGRDICIGLYPCGQHWVLRARLIAPPGKGKELQPTWARFEKSLRRPK